MAEPKTDPKDSAKLLEQAEKINQLQAQVITLQNELEAIRKDPIKAEPIEVQQMVVEKMAMGLDHGTALTVARAQYANDKRQTT